MRGQVLVELALALPVILFAALGFIEAGALMATWAAQGRTTGALADWSALHPEDAEGWHSLLASDARDCSADVTTEVSGMVRVTLTCPYRPLVTSNLWDGLPITTEAIAAVRAMDSPSSPTPSP